MIYSNNIIIYVSGHNFYHNLFVGKLTYIFYDLYFNGLIGGYKQFFLIIHVETIMYNIILCQYVKYWTTEQFLY